MNKLLSLSMTVCLSLLQVACGGGSKGSDLKVAANAGSLKVLSSRSDLVSGGDVLVEWTPAPGVDPATARVLVGTKDVSSSFAVRPNGRYIGLVSGLENGANQLVLKAGRGGEEFVTGLTLINRPAGGPMIYGPQVPVTCDAGASDAACNRPVSYTYLYKSTDGTKTALLPYSPSSPPADVATTTTDTGKSVPYIVRVETGVINRDYYNIAVLWNPAQDWQPWAPQEGWNQKVVFMHGRGLGTSYRQLATITAEVTTNLYALSKGFAVASSALNDNGHNVNLVVQAEAMMMLKERLIESYGEVRYAIGQGGSGGAIAQQWVANAYPGIYNGLILSASFPDSGSTAVEIEDCGLLDRYFSDASLWASGVSWSGTQKREVQGSLGDSCENWARPLVAAGIPEGFTRIFDPTHSAVTALPGTSPTVVGGCDADPARTYHPVSNPTGIRCTVQDYVAGIMGLRADGFANRPYANVGVQYGLGALHAGTISLEQFVDLNSKLGSHNIDFVHQPFRTTADPVAIVASYRSGWINGANGMNHVAILDVRATDTSSIHHQFRSWAMRSRLDRANGHHRNQVIWYNSGRTTNQALDAMDAWLRAVEIGPKIGTLADRIVANRPASLTDVCGSQVGTNLTMVQCTGVADASPRMVAGGPIADDVLDCRLAALDRSKYPAAMTEAQWARMQATFPTGVCDYTQPGVGQQATTTWMTYVNADGSVRYGGTALPALE